MKTNQFIYILALSAALLVGCKGRTTGQGETSEENKAESESVASSAQLTGDDKVFHERKKGLVEAELEKQVDSLAGKSWPGSKEDYARLARWIDNPDLDLSYGSRSSFRSLLDGCYCISLDNDADRIMRAGNCSQSHARLKDIMTVRAGFDPGRTDIGKAVRDKYNEHERLRVLVGSFSTSQSVSTFSDKYDVSFETAKKKEALDAYNAYAAKYKEPACSVLKQLKTPSFSTRRQLYCERILSLYEASVRESGKVVTGEWNRVDGTLSNIYGKEDSRSAGWKGRMDALKTNYEVVE